MYVIHKKVNEYDLCKFSFVRTTFTCVTFIKLMEKAASGTVTANSQLLKHRKSYL